MTVNPLEKAIALAESVRFTSDHGRSLSGDGTLESSDIRYQFDQRGLRVSANMTPGIHSVLEAVSRRLYIDSGNILAFIHASSELQARCYSGDTKNCLITLTSGLIQLMEKEELAFVIGHELGHFLLGHGARQEPADASIEGMMRQRSCEISADRVGMLASSEENVAFRALIKLSCGLGTEQLRYDVGTYLEQIRSPAEDSYQPASDSTHPSLVIRCRALLRFQRSQKYRAFNGLEGGESLERIDERLSRDLKRFVDNSTHKRISEARKTLQIWLAVAAAIRYGTVGQKEQALLNKELGEDTCDKVMNFLRQYDSKTEIESIVRDKLREATDFYRSSAPEDYEKEVGKLTDSIGSKFSQSDFQRFIESFLASS